MSMGQSIREGNGVLKQFEGFTCKLWEFSCVRLTLVLCQEGR